MEKLLDAYATGLPFLGWQNLFDDPTLRLDELKLPKALANYGHALCFGSFLDAIHSGRYLWNHLPKQFEGKAKESLKEELGLLQIACLKGAALDIYLETGQLDGALSERSWTPNEARVQFILNEKLDRLEQDTPQDPWIQKILPFANNVQIFRKSQASLWKLYHQHQVHFTRPFYPIHFRGKGNLLPQAEFRVEPYDDEWEALIAQLPRPACLRFRTPKLLLQCLQFSALAQALVSRRHLIYVDNLYPNRQLQLQPIYRQVAQKLTSSELRPAILQTRAEISQDTSVGDSLYHHLRHESFKEELEYLGETRFLALRAKHHQFEWHDAHKARPIEASLFQQDLDARLAHYLAKHHPQAPKRCVRRKRLRLTHVVPQVVSGGHAPSKLLKTLLENHNREQFEPSLFVTERLQIHLAEYPYPTHFSHSSLERGGEILKEFQDHGIPVYVEDARLDFTETAARLSKGLQTLNSDVVIFHGPDEINLIAARTCGAPLTVFFEHGTLPAQRAFDLVISSTVGAAQQFQEQYAQMGSRLVGVPFVLDIRSQWEPAPPQKNSLGVPEGGKIMTTISNHLESRLGPDMIWAICEILRRNPDAYYCPMGPIIDEGAFKAPFVEAGFGNRVLPLGTQPQPSQLARCMHLYLNEFPFGSCIGMLDAMAAGCPPVTMYDPKGPPQARYGGDYFGVDRAVRSGDREEYVALACRLLSDEDLYENWSLTAKALYEQRADVKAYVRHLEALILECLNEHADEMHPTPFH